MAILNFKEIPEANKATGKQDTFELFARDFLVFKGFRIHSGPARGIDGGRDLIVVELRQGIGGETKVRWLVSCKHYAHSGKSIGKDDELDIMERLENNNCTGFLGFYSTLPSSGLQRKVEGLRSLSDVLFYDFESIEGDLLRSSRGLELARRYFPNSMQNWGREEPTPAKIFSDKPQLLCKACNADLLDPPRGIIVIWEDLKYCDDHKGKCHHIATYWCCKGQCDERLKSEYNRPHVISLWEDITDLLIPTVFIRFVMATINQLYRGDKFSENAIDNQKELMLSIFPHIARHLSQKEKDRMERLIRIPSYLGGLGYE